jgi:molecular chaperone DnaK
MSSSRAVGIDLGTTNCARARFEATGRTAMIRNSQGDLLIPSTVFFEDDELLFGRAANQGAATQPERAAECVKRDFGQSFYSRALGGELLPAELIAACLLRNLCRDVPQDAGAPPAVAMAVPAAFDQAQRRGMIDAARIAGIDLLGTITDPLATALSFAEAQGYLAADTKDKPGCRVLVFDLGGGKLDAAIVEIKHRRLRTLAVTGDERLGGRDWDQQLAEYLAAKFTKEFGDDPRYDMLSVRRLLAGAEEAKHTLTARQQARVHIERHGFAADIVVQRHAFEEAATDLVDRARHLAEDTVAQAGLAWKDLSHLLLVGGATRMPMIAKMIESVTGLKPAANMHADEAVARGAALYAEQLLAARQGGESATRIDITDMTAHSMGIQWKEPGTDRFENVVLIPRGAEMPCGTSSKLATDVDDQSTIEVQLLEGESRIAEQCRRVAQIKISDLPNELPKNSVIDAFYQISAEGRLQVKAQLQKGGHPLSITVERAGGLAESEVADWCRVLQADPGLKAIHAQLAKHVGQRPTTPRQPPPTDAPGDANPNRAESAAGPDGFQLDVDEKDLAERRATPRITLRSIAIMLGGHVVFAILGLVIGYYILMVIRPEWNVLRLPLPGVRLETPRGSDVPTGDIPTGDVPTGDVPTGDVSTGMDSSRVTDSQTLFVARYRNAHSKYD